MLLRARSALSSVAVVAALVLATAAPAAAQAPARVLQTGAGPIEMRTVARGLVHPWGLAFLPDGRMLATERPGRLRIVAADGTLGEPVAGVPAVAATGQGGLLDVVLDPAFAQNRLVYMSFAEPGEGGAGTAVVRGRLVEEGGRARLDGATVIFRVAKKSSGGRHFGSRLVFARDGNLFVTLGDRGEDPRAQDPNDHAAKVVRIRPDGTVPPDNPFVNRAGTRPEIFSLGHRNPQGAALHPQTGELWIVDHGAAQGDEVNVVEAGRNYGWPIISYGRQYWGGQIGEGTAKPGLEQPLHHFPQTIAPSGLAFYTGTLVPAWRGQLFAGGLRSQVLLRLTFEGRRLAAEERIDVGARVRDVRSGPDGALWLLTDESDGRILRLAPPAGRS